MAFKRGHALRWCAAVLCIASAALRTSSGQDIIDTVAGGGVGASGTAMAAVLNNPLGTALLFNPSTGGVVLYIADTDNHQIRRVGEAGAITTVAGFASTLLGDGGPATAAKLNSPYGASVLYNASSGGVVLYQQQPSHSACG
ncbi:hypothetical protein EON66_10765 [archaeon]|nr:MAG: hypothetical protein EON66_10765 [archaeon]